LDRHAEDTYICNSLADQPLSVSTAGEATIAQFLQDAESSKEIQNWIGMSGSMSGWTNTYLEKNHQQPIYCEPADPGITSEQYRSILVSFVDKHPRFLAMSANVWQQALLLALIDAFPCNAA
jgi:hypothetical protein